MYLTVRSDIAADVQAGVTEGQELATQVALTVAPLGASRTAFFGARALIQAGSARLRLGLLRLVLDAGKRRTAALARSNIGGVAEEIVAVSGGATRGVGEIGKLLLGSTRVAANTTRSGVRALDAEVKILDDIAGRIPKNARGNIDLFVDFKVCASCSRAIEVFRREFPNIVLTVLEVP